MYLSYVSYLLVYLIIFFLLLYFLTFFFANMRMRFDTHTYAYSHSCEHTYVYMIFFPNSYSTCAMSYCVDVFREYAF